MPKGDVGGVGWADEIADLLVEVKDAIEQGLCEGGSGLSAGQLRAYRSPYTKLVSRSFAAVPCRPGTGPAVCTGT